MIVKSLFKKAQGHLSWPVLAGSCAASPTMWEKLWEVYWSCAFPLVRSSLWAGCVARHWQQAGQSTCAAIAGAAYREEVLAVEGRWCLVLCLRWFPCRGYLCCRYIQCRIIITSPTTKPYLGLLTFTGCSRCQLLLLQICQTCQVL